MAYIDKIQVHGGEAHSLRATIAGATANTLPPGSEATAEVGPDGGLVLGIPRGDAGTPGDPHTWYVDCVPTAAVSTQGHYRKRLVAAEVKQGMVFGADGSTLTFNKAESYTCERYDVTPGQSLTFVTCPNMDNLCTVAFIRSDGAVSARFKTSGIECVQTDAIAPFDAASVWIMSDTGTDRSKHLSGAFEFVASEQKRTVIDGTMATKRDSGYLNMDAAPTFETVLINVRRGDCYLVQNYDQWNAYAWVHTDMCGKIIASSEGNPSGMTRRTEAFVVDSDGLLVLTYSSDMTSSYAVHVERPSMVGKRVGFDGDAISASYFDDVYANGGAYAKICAETLGYAPVNVATGRTISDANGNRVGPDNLPSDIDMAVFQGGVNDYWNNVPMGELTGAADFDGPIDTSTFYGGLERILRGCVAKFGGKPVMFVTTHKIKGTDLANSVGLTFDDYQEAIRLACAKYSVPVVDVNAYGGINTRIKSQADAFSIDGEGVNLTEEGYRRYYAPMVAEAIARHMPA